MTSLGMVDVDADPEAAMVASRMRESWMSKPTPSTSSSGLRNLRVWLWPSSESWTARPKSLHSTAYLDGLRGFAALLVYWHHQILWAHSIERTAENLIFENGFGYNGYYRFAALPFVRNFFTGGHFAVSTFFVLSGYVLSIKSLKLVENDDMLALVDHIASSIFRRWLRLFMPVVGSVLIYVTFCHVFNVWVQPANWDRSWFEEMVLFYYEFKNFSYLYKEGGVPWLSYNPHLWSIPVEFKGSLVVFVSTLSLARCTTKARLWCEAGLIFYFMWIADGAYCAMFCVGMLLCHLQQLASMDRLPAFIRRFEPYKSILSYHALVAAFYLGGVPAENNDIKQLAKTRGWYLLSFLKPQAVFDYKWFYLFWAATLLVAGLPHIAWLKRLFETRMCQYLGRICYGLYLVHGPIIWLFGDRLYAAVGFPSKEHYQHIPNWINRVPLPKSGPMGLEINFLLCQVILLPVTVLFADLATKGLDKPSANFAAWLYNMTLAGSSSRRRP